MGFDEVLRHLKQGDRVSRKDWGPKRWLAVILSVDCKVTPEGMRDAMVVRPWIAMRTHDAALVPWAPSQQDVLASDWEVWQP